MHLWTEGTMRTIGEDIGFVETIDITNTAARMRVHVNGRLPLIKSTVIEYSGGEEVSVTLVYERLERHCSLCHRLDHELRDCLEAKAQKRAQLALKENKNEQLDLHKETEEEHEGEVPHDAQVKFNSTRNKAAYPTTNTRRMLEGRYDRRHERDRRYHPYEVRREETRRPQRDDLRGKSMSHDTHQIGYERRTRARSYRASDSHCPEVRSPSYRTQPYYREIPKPKEYTRREESLSSKNVQEHSIGVPQKKSQVALPKEAMETAMGEVREFMTQYSNVADPNESAARKERFRQAEEEGEVEEDAALMVRESLVEQVTAEPIHVETTQDRIHVSRRISFPPIPETSAERIPATLRLSTSPNGREQERIPATLRLGPIVMETNQPKVAVPITSAKRKPGRPPETWKVTLSGTTET